jgi:hypothetical protein
MLGDEKGAAIHLAAFFASCGLYFGVVKPE